VSWLIQIFFLSSCATSPKLPLADVDLKRMYGGWYIVATIPNWFEKGMVAPYDVYSPRPDSDIQEDFSVRWGSFDSPLKKYVVHDWVRPGTKNAHWRVQVLWPIHLPFLVLYTDSDYQYVLYGEDDKSLGWIYSRKPDLDETKYQELLGRFKSLGYDVSRFKKIVQNPNQIGLPGYWNEGIKK
jgi:apolipoprotein D and lipocalin family protein